MKKSRKKIKIEDKKTKGLKEYRDLIDELDEEIVELFQKRMRISRIIGKIKEKECRNIKDDKREEEVLGHIKANSDEIFEKYVEELYSKIFQISRNYQREKPYTILVINGPNINFLGEREVDIYGRETYEELINKMQTFASSLGIYIEEFQSNYEGVIITEIQEAKAFYDAIIINAGAYTHTSIAILDALKIANLPTVEVHISDFKKRESFRNISYVSEASEKVISGKGTFGYLEAIEYLHDKYYLDK